MNIVLVLIKRNLLKIKSSLSIYLSILLFFPLLLYLFLSIPLSLIIDMKPIYLHWSSSGIWVVTTIYLSYLISFHAIKQNFESESFLSLPILSWQIIVSHYFYISIIAISQLIISMFIINIINNDFLNISNYFLLIFLTLPAIIIVCNISFIIFVLISNKIFSTFLHTFIFLLLSFGYGAFIPIHYFPESYYKIVSYFPLVGTILNYQRILKSENILFSSFLINIFFAIFLFLIVLFILEKQMKDRY